MFCELAVICSKDFLLSSDQYPIRRVPLRSLWIKGIRTVWQLKKELGLLWVATIVVPFAVADSWLLPGAVDAVKQLQDSVSADKTTDITAIMTTLTPILTSLTATYFALFLAVGFG